MFPLARGHERRVAGLGGPRRLSTLCPQRGGTPELRVRLVFPFPRRAPLAYRLPGTRNEPIPAGGAAAGRGLSRHHAAGGGDCARRHRRSGPVPSRAVAHAFRRSFAGLSVGGRRTRCAMRERVGARCRHGGVSTSRDVSHGRCRTSMSCHRAWVDVVCRSRAAPLPDGGRPVALRQADWGDLRHPGAWRGMAHPSGPHRPVSRRRFFANRS